MKAKLNILVIAPLVFLMAFVPVFCCCLASSAQAQGQMAGAVADNHKCCDSQTKNNHPQQDSSKCDCPNHTLAKATNIASVTLDAFLAQNHSSPYQSNFLTLVLSSDDSRALSAYQVVHSPPLQSSSPLYIQQHSLRI